MRHRVHGRKLGRTSAHREAMFRNQLTALITHERITTTLAKAKELRPLAERMVTLARTGTLANRRRVLQTITDKTVAQRLFEDVAPRFADRPGGYTRIVRVGRRRGDNAELAIIEFVDFEPKFDDEGAGRGKSSLMDRAKGIFGGRKDEASADADVSASADAEAPADDEGLEAAEDVVEAETTEESAQEPVEVEPEAAEDTPEPEEPAAEAKAEEADETAVEAKAASGASADADADAEAAEEAEAEAEEKKD